MSCPDINEFLDALDEGDLPPRLQRHLDGCRDCQTRMWIVEAIPAVLNPDLEVPEGLFERAMAGIRAAREEELRRMDRLGLLGTVGVGWLTALVVLLGTGAGNAGGPESLLLYSLAAGLVSGAFRRWQGWPPEDLADGRMHLEGHGERARPAAPAP